MLLFVQFPSMVTISLLLFVVLPCTHTKTTVLFGFELVRME